jgi:hypothetical protein
VSRLSLDSFSSVVLYLGYLFLLVILDFLVTGQSSGSFIDSLLLTLIVVDRYYRILGYVLGYSEDI